MPNRLVRTLFFFGLGACGTPQEPARTIAKERAPSPIVLPEGAKIGVLAAEPGESERETIHYPSLSLSKARGKVSLDALLGEWPPLTSAKQRSTERAKEASVNLLYDNDFLYVAGEIHDGTLTRTDAFGEHEDRLNLRLSFLGAKPNLRSSDSPRRSSFDLVIYAGKPGDSEGMVKHLNRQVPGSKIVEALFDGGYRFEAAVPWSYLTKGGEPRVGLLANATYYDAETNSTTSTSGTKEDPWAPSEPELAAWERLSPETRDSARPEATLVGDYAGGPELEVAEVVARELWVVGHAFLDGTRYFSRTVSGRTTLSECKFSFLTKPTIIIEESRDVRAGNVVSKTFYDASTSVPRVLLQHAVQFGNCKNDLRIEADKIVVTGPTDRCDGPGDLSWVSVAGARVTYRWNGSELVADTQAGPKPIAVPQAEKPREAPAARTPEKPMTSDPVAMLLQTRKLPANTKPDFVLRGNVAEDPEAETIVVLDGEIIVLGEHFRAGTAFVSVRPGGVGKSKIAKIELKRFEGIASSFLAVTLVHTLDDMVPPLTLESLALYAVKSNLIERVLWVETKRIQGDRKREASVAFYKQGVTTTLAVARGWTKENYATGEIATDLIALPPPWDRKKRVEFEIENGRFRKK